MKGQWRVVYRFKFPWNPRAGQWRSRVFNTEEAANKFLQDVCALHDAEGKVQPATFRLPRNIAITIDGKIVKRNPMKRESKGKRDYMAYLEHTIIPDTIEAGREGTAEDLQTVLDILKTGSPSGGWRTITQFKEYLRDTLIPDLRESGSDGYVKDFMDALKYMRPTKTDAKTRREELYGPDRLRRNPVRKFSRRKRRVAAKNAFAPFGYYPKRSYLQAATRVRKPMKQNPLKLKPLKSNMTELSIDVPGFRGETKILFSYQTPVAAYNLSPEWHDQFGGSFIRTSKKWSVTTSKHINQWLEGAKAHSVDQSVLDNLSEGKMKTNPLRTRKSYPVVSALEFGPGDRIEMSPSTDWWMRGARYGDVVKVLSTGMIAVKLDKVRRQIKVHPSNLQLIEKMKTNPHKRSSKKPLSAKQKAAREKFVKMVRSGAFKKRGRNAPKRDPFGGYARRKKINPMRRKRARKAKAAKFILCLPRIGDSRMWYYGAKANQVTTVKSDAKIFSTEVGALAEARAHKFRLAKHGFFEARTQRI